MATLSPKTKLTGTNRPLDIKRTPSNKKWTEADYIADAVEERSLRDAADWLNENLPEIFQRTHSSVDNWLKGINEPDDVFLHALFTHYPETDPRYKLAADLLALRERAAELEHA